MRSGVFFTLTTLGVMFAFWGCVLDGVSPEGYLILRAIQYHEAVGIPITLTPNGDATTADDSLPSVVTEADRIRLVDPQGFIIEYLIGDYEHDKVKAAFSIRSSHAESIQIPLDQVVLASPGGSRKYNCIFVGLNFVEGERTRMTSPEQTAANRAVFYDPSPFDVRETSRPTVFERTKKEVVTINQGEVLDILFWYDGVPSLTGELELRLPISVQSRIRLYTFAFEKWDYYRATDAGVNNAGRAISPAFRSYQ